MAMCSSSNIRVDGLHIGLDLISKLVERFGGGFTTDWSEFCSLEERVLVVDRAQHGG